MLPPLPFGARESVHFTPRETKESASLARRTRRSTTKNLAAGVFPYRRDGRVRRTRHLRLEVSTPEAGVGEKKKGGKIFCSLGGNMFLARLCVYIVRAW